MSARDVADWALPVLAGALTVFIAAVVFGIVRDTREQAAWEDFAARHCRLTGSYDKEAERATPVVARHGLKVYHCDDGTIHVR